MFVTGLSAQWSQQGPFGGPGRKAMAGMAAIQGRITPRRDDTKDLQVVLTGESGGTPATADVSAAGTFSFPAIPYGHYVLRLLDAGKQVSERSVSVDDLVETVDLELPRDRRENNGDGTVSVSELQHRVPARALQEAQKGESALRKKKVEEAIGHFESALEIDPDYAAAREGLANVCLQKHDDGRAVTHLEVLLRQRPSSIWAWTNLSAAQFRLGRAAEAEAAARRALALDATQKINRYVLGISLAAQGKNPDEALASLRQSCDKFPLGHVVAARILAARGDIAGARDQLESYLGSDSPEDRVELQAWLARHPRPQVSASAAVPDAR